MFCLLLLFYIFILSHTHTRTYTANDILEGQYGLMDQILALKWIQENIAAFGGNPSDVTLSGQSAGGTSTAVHLCSPLSQGLFHRAIIQSNPWALPLKTRTQATSLGKSFAKKLNCEEIGASSVACMRGKSAQDVLVAQLKQNDIHVIQPLLC